MKSLNTLLRAVPALSLATILSASAATVGSTAPDFELKDTDGVTRKLSDFSGKTVVLEWVNHGCPIVRKHYDSDNMQATQRTATEDGVVWLSICSSAPGEQGNATPAEWKRLNAENKSAASAVLIDESGTVGRLYKARTTPHMFVIDASGILVYAGAIDSIPSGNKADIAHAENYVLAALGDIEAGRPVSTASTRPYGCGIKYAD